MRKTFLALIFSVFALFTFVSCEGLESMMQGDEFTQCMGINNANDILSGLLNASMDETNCPRFTADYNATIANEGRLLTDDELKAMVNANGDFAMSISLNATGIKKLFEHSVSWADEFPVTIDIGGCYSPNDPQAQNCLAFGFKISGHQVKFGVPIESKLEPEKNKTSIMANLENAKIINLTGEYLADAAIELAVKTLFNSYLRRYAIFEIAAWEVGNGDIKMFAGAPKVHIDNATGYKAIEIGMYSNIAFTQDAINIARNMPHEAELGIHIHPDLIRGIIGRMMTEKKSGSDDTYVTRNVTINDSSANASQTNTSFHVTMTDLTLYPQAQLYACSADWRDYFTFGFRLWSTEAFCGYMDLLAGFRVEITDNKFEIGLGNIHGGYSEGAMSLANGIFNTITTTDFFHQLMDYTNISINFNEMTVGDSNAGEGAMRRAEMAPDEHMKFTIDGSGISLYLNFLNL